MSVDRIDGETLQHYYDLYWEHFHPSFPVIHRPTVQPREPSSLPNAMVLAIGSAFSTRPLAKQHSATWYSHASRKCFEV